MSTQLKIGDKIKITQWGGISDDLTLGKTYTVSKRCGQLGFRDNVGDFRYISGIRKYIRINKGKLDLSHIKQFGIVNWTAKYYK